MTVILNICAGNVATMLPPLVPHSERCMLGGVFLLKASCVCPIMECVCVVSFAHLQVDAMQSTCKHYNPA